MAADAVLTEQLDYYRARAGEYDRWWLRQGRFDRGAEANARWFAESAELERALETFAPTGNVLELACGTGLWTRHLIRCADRLTAVDGSAEVLAINRARLAGTGDGKAARAEPPEIDYVQADLFEWAPEPAAYDVCFFSFWLSHVPSDRFAPFWDSVARALRPGGRVLFFDSARAERSTAADHRLPDHDEQTMTRRLDDGREFQIIKRFWDPPALHGQLAELGWHATVGSTGEFFIHGSAQMSPQSEIPPG
jgi:demethylmenaquinone methyltransferase/2-methoxy-6-polyprenyl-1,4-benzoquinol methylase